MHSPRAQADKKLYQFTMKHRVEAQPNLTLRQEMVEGIADRGDNATRRLGDTASRECRRGRARRYALSRAGRGPDHRHVPQGAHAHRRSQDARRPGRRRHRRGAQRQPRRVRLRARPLQDRHALPAQRPDHRLREAAKPQPGDAEPRPFSFATERIDAAADGLPHHLHQRGGPRPDPRQPAPGADVLRPDPGPRAALLSVDRGQGGPLRRQGAPSDLPGAGRPQHARILLQRHQHQPAQGRAAGDAAADSRPGERRGAALGLRRRIRLRPADAASADAGNQAGRRACSSPARSTAPPATKKRRPRG